MSRSGDTAARAPLALVVDDYADGRELTVHYLRLHGFRVAQAATGRDAIDAAARLKPDLVLLDLVMPDVDGWFVIARLRERRATTNARMRIVLHTASVTEDVRERARLEQVDLFLPRPCDLSGVARQLAALIDRSSPER